MKTLKKMTSAVALIAAMSATSLSAAPLVLTDSTLQDFSWAGGPGNTLDGSGTVSATGFGTTSLVLSFALTNGAPLASDRLTAFGFSVDPNAQTVSFNDDADGGLVAGNLFGGNIGSGIIVEICAWGGPNCNGGGSGGIAGNGGSDAFTLTLTSLTNWTSATLDPIAFKYQTDNGSFEFSSSSGSSGTSGTSGTSGSNGSVPEPGSMALLGLGLVGLGFARRRKMSA